MSELWKDKVYQRKEFFANSYSMQNYYFLVCKEYEIDSDRWECLKECANIFICTGKETLPEIFQHVREVAQYFQGEERCDLYEDRATMLSDEVQQFLYETCLENELVLGDWFEQFNEAGMLFLKEVPESRRKLLTDHLRCCAESFAWEGENGDKNFSQVF